MVNGREKHGISGKWQNIELIHDTIILLKGIWVERNAFDISAQTENKYSER